MVIPQVPVYKRRPDRTSARMVPKRCNGPPHSVVTALTADALRANLPAEYCLRTEKPITLSDSQPELDIVIAIGNPRQYVDRHPIPGEIALVVEVSDTTLNRDRQIKLKLYAAAEFRATGSSIL